MSEDLGAIKWRVEVDTSDLNDAEEAMSRTGETAERARKSATGLGNETEKASKKGAKAATEMEKSFSGAAAAVDLAKKAVLALGVSIGAREIIQFSDSWKQVNNQLRQVTTSEGDLSKTRANLVAISKQTNAELLNTVNLYSEMYRATRELEVSEQDVANVTKTINNLFKAGGKAASETSGAIRQLAQGLASGALRGDEFISVSENAPRILDAISKSTGIAKGELRDFAATGGITSKILIDSLKSYEAEAQRMADLTEETFGQKMVTARTNLTQFLGESNAVTAAVDGLGDSIVVLSDNMDAVIAVGEAAALVIAARLTPAVVGYTVAQVAATTENLRYQVALARMAGVSTTAAASQTALAGSLALVGGPVGALVLVIGGLALLISKMESAKESAARLRAEMDSLSREEIGRGIEAQRTYNKALEIRIERLSQQNMAVAANRDRMKELRAELEFSQKELQNLERGMKGVEDREFEKMLDDYFPSLVRLTDATGKAAEATQKAKEAFDKQSSALESARKMLGMTEREAFIYEERLKAIATGATPEMIAAIEASAAALFDESKQFEKATDSADAYTKAQEEMREAVNGQRLAVGNQIASLVTQLHQIDMTEREAYIYQQRMQAIANGALPETVAAIDALSGSLYDQRTAAEKVAKAHEEAARQIVEDYRDMREDLSDIYQDMARDAQNIGDIIEGIFRGVALNIAGDFAAALTLDALGANPTGQGFSLAGSLGNAGSAGKIISAGLTKFAPGLAGSLGLGAASTAAAADAAGYVALMGANGAAVGGSAAASTGIMAGLKGALASVPGWGWALAGAAALTMMFDKKSTPSYNAGFLTDPTTPLGKSGQSFQTDAFASGFAPTGFYRRSSQQEAEQVIDVFRQLDSTIVSMASSAGLTASLKTLRGLNETLLAGTSGTVFGAGGQDGAPGMAIQQQLDMFAKQLIESLRGQIADSDLQQILNAGGVDQMLATMEQILGKTEDVVAGIDAIADAEQRLAAEREQAVASFETALSAARNYMAELVAEQNRLIEEQMAAVRQRYSEEMRQAQSLHDMRLRLFQSLQAYTTSLRLGDKTILSPQQQLDLARSQFQGLAGTALNTNLSMEERLKAAEGLQGAADQYLTAGRGMFASNTQYKDIFNEVMQALEASKFLGTNQEWDGSAQQQALESAMLAELQALNSQMGQLPAGIAAALAPLMNNLIVQALASGKSKEFIANTITGLGPDAVAGANQGGLLGQDITQYATSAATIALQFDYLKSNSRNEGELVGKLVAQAQQYGLSAAQVSSALGLSEDEGLSFLQRYGYPAFADGGMHAGGIRLVGERGPELEATGPARYWNNQQTMAMLGGGSQEVVVELRALRQENQQLRTAVDRLVSIELQRGEQEGRQMQDNNQALSEISSTLRSNTNAVGSRKYGSAA